VIKLPYVRIANPEVHQEVKMLANDHGVAAGILVSEILSASLRSGEAERIAEEVSKKAE
jgi:hypothetical protein